MTDRITHEEAERCLEDALDLSWEHDDVSAHPANVVRSYIAQQRERDAEIERLRAALAPYALVRSVDGTYVWCSECKQYIDDPGHRKGCVLEGVLKP